MKDIKKFLKESNAIEGIYDGDSLIQALVAWDYIMLQSHITPHDVLKTHKILMLNQKGLRPNERGYFRTIPVYIGREEAMASDKIPEYIEAWCELMNGDYTDTLQEEISQDLHIKYEKIHPFADGNGRTGRIFMNWWRVKNGLPILIIKESERFDYYKWF